MVGKKSVAEKWWEFFPPFRFFPTIWWEKYNTEPNASHNAIGVVSGDPGASQTPLLVALSGELVTVRHGIALKIEVL